jgi:hypothetical protein
MKNVHLIAIDKPSRLWTNNLKRRLELDEFPSQHPINVAKNLYITSEEEIKEGYYLDLTHNIVMKAIFYSSSDKNCKKIILTTDQDLIADAIQPIDDAFLEWFIKNSSCEKIEIERNFADEGFIGIAYYGKYFIIIPQEQPKQETLEEVATNYAEGWGVNDDATSFILGAKWKEEQILQFIHSKMAEPKNYSSSEMCGEIMKFIKQNKK